MADSRALLEKIVDYAEYYDKEFLSSMGRVSELVNGSKGFDSVASVGQAWLQDPSLALASAAWYGCARQGTPARYWLLAAEAIKNTISRVGLYGGTLPQEVWRQFEYLCRYSKSYFEENNQRRNHTVLANKGPVVKDLTSLHLDHKNLICYIRNQLANDTKRTHFVIRANVHGMGDKTTSLLLRDVAWVYNLEGKGSLGNVSQAVYVQPVDIWVRRLAERLWPDLEGKRDWKVVALRITAECKQAKVSAIRFNQGAWYFGVRLVESAGQLCSELAVSCE